MGRQSRQAGAQPPELTASSYKRLLNADYGTANPAAGRITAKLTQVHPPNLLRGPLAACQIKSGCKQGWLVWFRVHQPSAQGDSACAAAS